MLFAMALDRRDVASDKRPNAKLLGMFDHLAYPGVAAASERRSLDVSVPHDGLASQRLSRASSAYNDSTFEDLGGR
jgi:hypothetical protein